MQWKPLSFASLPFSSFDTVTKGDSAKTALPTLARMQRRMSVTIREYKFFRSFSQKFENWPKRKAEALWRKMRERKIAGERRMEKKSENFSTPQGREIIKFQFPFEFWILNLEFEFEFVELL